MATTTHFFKIASIAVVTATLAACGSTPLSSSYPSTSSSYPSTTTYPSGGYPTTQSGGSTQNYVEYGRVTDVQVIQNQEAGRTTGAGAVLGGLAGGVIGNQIGGGSGRDVARIAGIAGGAIAGNEIEKNRSTQVVESYRVTVQTDNGSIRSFNLATNTGLRTGDRVRIENGQVSRY